MTGWNEDNFIEKVIPLLGPRPGAAPCPEAVAFLAASDGDTGEILKKAMAEHASGCPACRDLQQRMKGFDAPMAAGHDAEWKQAEKRLDNWFDSFLASEAAVHLERGRIGASRPRLWTWLTSPRSVRQLRWALVPAVTLALVICSFLAGRISVRRSPRITAEVNRLPAATTPPRTVVEQRGELTGKSPVSRTPRLPPRSLGETASASSAPGPMIPPPDSSTAPENGSRPTETAALAPPEPLQSPTGSSTPVSPSAPGSRAVATAENSGSALSIGPAGPAVPPSSRTTPSGMRSILASRGVVRAPEAREGRPPAISTPSVITLDAGTRVWIALKSIHSGADGESEFRGVVLLPVTQSGATLLGRNTEVSGTVTVRNGKRSVQILEFLTPGAHYRLRGASGEANLRLPGAGEAVEFDTGRVLEAWMAAISTYEKRSGESRPPE